MAFDMGFPTLTNLIIISGKLFRYVLDYVLCLVIQGRCYVLSIFHVWTQGLGNLDPENSVLSGALV